MLVSTTVTGTFLQSEDPEGQHVVRGVSEGGRREEETKDELFQF